MPGQQTLVSLSWRKRRRNHRLLFGAPARIVRLDWQRQIAVFSVGDIFAYERWRAGKYGTVEWQVYVLQCGSGGERLCRVAGVRPGVHVLLNASGKDASKRALALLEALGEQAELTSFAPAIWARLASQLAAGLDPDPVISRVMWG